MSTIETILTRMMSEPAFADAAFANVEKALAEYNLSVDEIARFKDMSRAQFEVFAANPENRKSMGSTNTIGGSGFFKIRNEGG